jgi:hypothetical protein
MEIKRRWGRAVLRNQTPLKWESRSPSAGLCIGSSQN